MSFTDCRTPPVNALWYLDVEARCIIYKGHGKSLKSTGPPRPASASRRLIITAIAASSLLGLLDPWSLSIMSMPIWEFSPVSINTMSTVSEAVLFCFTCHLEFTCYLEYLNWLSYFKCVIRSDSQIQGYTWYVVFRVQRLGHLSDMARLWPSLFSPAVEKYS